MVDDDFGLLDRWRAGDRAAGNLLFKRHFESLYRFLAHKVDGEIDDLVQDTFVACMHGRDTFRRQSSFRTYLFAIARNMLFGYWRRNNHGRSQLDFEEISIASLSTSVRSRLAHGEERESLLLALRELPVEQQILLELYYWEDLNRDQLADVFDVDTATIGSRLFRARQALRGRLEQARPAPAVQPGEDLDAWAR
ncbi:MAG TPA: RNA polymerase sigma factor, partial [Kofleriaceae bacterium]|nr:RNA polymerase sigma factor [Kofleriaceae bacterium]